MNAEQIAMNLPGPLKKAVILGHSAARADWKSIRASARRIAEDKGTSAGRVLADMATSCWRYGVTPKEFLAFRMAYQDEEVRRSWAGKLLIKELQHRLSSEEANTIFHDKRAFAETFGDMLGRPVMCLTDGDADAFSNWLNGIPGTRIVAKPRFGAVGKGVQVVELGADVDPARLRNDLLASGADMVEGYVEQHEALAALYPGSVNTIRVMTLNRQGTVAIIGAVLRFGISGNVDNLGAGGRAASVSITDGRIEGPAVTSDATEAFTIDTHPVTGTRIPGFQVPMWEEVKRLALDAASVVPEAGTVGWDVAVSRHGPLLIEGNHDWDLVLWQLPGQKGKRELVEQLLRND